MTVKAGYEHTLYRGTAGTTANILMENVIDLDNDDSMTNIDVTTRKSGGFKSYIPGLREAGLSFGMIKDADDADYAALRAAYVARTPMAFVVSDGDGNGLDADWNISEFKDSQPLDDKATVSVVLSINTSIRAPEELDAEPTPAAPPTGG